MDKNILLESAKQLKQVSEKSANEYQSKMEHLVDLMNTRMLSRDDVIDLVGDKNLNMMKDNHANHARFISSELNNLNIDVLVETVLWVFRAYRSRGFKTNYWAAQLNSWIGILKEELSPEAYLEIIPYYEWMQVNIPIFVSVSDKKLEAPDTIH